MMESKIKSRVTPSVPSSVGRQIGVLPVGSVRPHRPKQGAYALPLSDGNRTKASLPSPHTSNRHRLSSRGPTPPDQLKFHAVEEDGIRFVDVPNDKKLSIKRRPPSGNSKRDKAPVLALDKTNLDYVVTVPNRKSSSIKRQSSGSSKNTSRPLSGQQSDTDQDLEEDEIFHPFKTISEEDVLESNCESDPEKIYEINLYAADITKINNLQRIKKLRVLDLSCNYIPKIENLRENGDIRELKLYGNRIQQIENLNSLRELNNLQLQHNKIKTVGKSLCQCTKIKTLNLSSNHIMKIDSPELSCCSQLTVLDVSNNMLDNLSFVNYLPNLEELNCSGNRVKSVDFRGSKRLQDLDLSGNDIRDLSGIKGLVNLQILNISNNRITTIKPVGKLKSLKELHASDNHISELSFFSSSFPQVEIINLSRNSIVSFEEMCSLNGLEELSELFISGNPFSSDDGMQISYMADIQAEFPNLEILDGAHLKRAAHKGAPLMRPMSASSIITVRQVESQMRQMDSEMRNFEEDISKRFDFLRSTLEKLPSEAPDSSRSSTQSVTQSTNFTKSSSHSRIRDALKFAAVADDDLNKI